MKNFKIIRFFFINKLKIAWFMKFKCGNTNKKTGGRYYEKNCCHINVNIS